MQAVTHVDSPPRAAARTRAPVLARFARQIPSADSPI